jgi:hypothetical protein
MTKEYFLAVNEGAPWTHATVWNKGSLPLKLSMRDLTRFPHSLGYLPLYDSLEKLREDCPNAKVLRLRGDVSFGETVQETRTYEVAKPPPG